ncbi:hypothetical protein Ntsu_40030 [Nocardia sp. IFM 10818]
MWVWLRHGREGTAVGAAPPQQPPVPTAGSRASGLITAADKESPLWELGAERAIEGFADAVFFGGVGTSKSTPATDRSP